MPHTIVKRGRPPGSKDSVPRRKWGSPEQETSAPTCQSTQIIPPLSEPLCDPIPLNLTENSVEDRGRSEINASYSADVHHRAKPKRGRPIGSKDKKPRRKPGELRGPSAHFSRVLAHNGSTRARAGNLQGATSPECLSSAEGAQLVHGMYARQWGTLNGVEHLLVGKDRSELFEADPMLFSLDRVLALTASLSSSGGGTAADEAAQAELRQHWAYYSSGIQKMCAKGKRGSKGGRGP